MSASKIKIKLGAIEVEYEGSEEFLKAELPVLLTAIAELYQKSNIPAQKNGEELSAKSPPPSGAPRNPDNGQADIQMTTGAIAARLNVSSGGELVMAAAARLSMVEKQTSFPRKRLIEQMKTATAYYRETYVSNLSATIKSLLKDNKLNEPSKDVFALTPSSEQALRARLA